MYTLTSETLYLLRNEFTKLFFQVTSRTNKKKNVYNKSVDDSKLIIFWTLQLLTLDIII